MSLKKIKIHSSLSMTANWFVVMAQYSRAETSMQECEEGSAVTTASVGRGSGAQESSNWSPLKSDTLQLRSLLFQNDRALNIILVVWYFLTVKVSFNTQVEHGLEQKISISALEETGKANPSHRLGMMLPVIVGWMSDNDTLDMRRSHCSSCLCYCGF